MSHPPFAHNPHVYDGVDPDGNPATAMVVHSDAIVLDGPRGEATNIETGVVTPAGEQLPDAPDSAYPAGATPLEPAASDEDTSTDVDGDGQITGYEVFTKVDLIAECEARKLPVSGNKPELVARLQEADKAAAPAENGG